MLKAIMHCTQMNIDLCLGIALQTPIVQQLLELSEERMSDLHFLL